MKHLFQNPWPHEPHRIVDIVRWKLKCGPHEREKLPDAPDEPAEHQVVLREEIGSPPAAGWRVVWLGHASFLVQGFGASILIDPIFSDYCSPIPIPALRRKAPLPLGVADLPPIDAVLITHSHYDHLDLPTLRRLAECPLIVTAEGHSHWLGMALSRPASELPWHGEMWLNEKIKITAVPAQHFSGRTPFDRNRGHWCGWLLEAAGSKIWHAGDSGYGPAFREIGERHGSIDFGMIPIGAYQPRKIMKPMHMNPEEAVMAFLDTACKRAIGMHWGTFSLTDEPMQEPPLRLEAETKRVGLASGVFTAGKIGSVWEI